MGFWKGRNVFVTGCAGFLGHWLTKHLLDRQAVVVGLIRDWVPAAPFFAEGLVGRITNIRGGLDDLPLLERAINEYEIDTVFHLAAQAIVGAANRSPVETFETNIRGTWNLLEACRRSKLVSRVVIASSDKAYGIHEELPYTEAHALKGTHPYDVSKSCADLISLAYHQTYGTPVCVTRCGNLFGGGDLNFSRLVPGTVRSALQGERPIIRSDGTMIRDYVYVEDIVEGYLLLAEQTGKAGIAGQAFNFATGQPLSVLQLTGMILRAAGREDLQPVILNEAKAEIPRQYLSSQLARTRLGWAPSKGVEDGLSQTIEWYRRYLARTAA
jgi:CDP-glucose 4,6-dehydratase